MTQDELVERLCETYEKYQKYLSGKKERDRDLEDIVQNVFLQAYTHLSSLRDVEALEAWVAAICRNERKKAGNEKKKQAELCEKLRMEYPLNQMNPYDEPDCITIKGNCFLIDELMDFIGGLDKKKQQILHLHFVLGMKYEEIEEKTGVKCSTIRSIVRRVRQSLRKPQETIE